MAFFDTGYYRAMDSEYVSPRDSEYPELEEKIEVKKKKHNLGLGPAELGGNVNPFTYPLVAMEARLHDGLKKMEFEFMGAGKGNKDSITPELLGTREREELKNLAKINKVRTSTHATTQVQGLAGFGEKGFNDNARDTSIREIEKAIDFAAEATTGGAIVFHTGEWQRPISEQKFAKKNGYTFKGFSTEDQKAAFYTVDKETGQISGISKDQTIYEPKFHTVKTFSKGKGYTKNSHGDYVNKDGKVIFELVGYDNDKNKTPKYKDSKKENTVYEDEWVDVDGRFISPDPKETDRWFDRVPQWNSEKTNFEVQPLKFNDLIKQAEDFKRRHGVIMINITPEQLYVRTQISNKVLQARGQSLYHAKVYEEHKFTRDKLKAALNFYEKLDKNLSKEEKWRLEQERGSYSLPKEFDILPTKESKIDFLKRKIKLEENEMRHIHESSASADAQAKQAEESIPNIQTIHDYGIDRTSDSIARLALKVWEKNKNKKDPENEDLYLAPENWQTHEFGSHPEEMIEIVEKARNKFVKDYGGSIIKDKEEAKKIAKQTIKTTIDIGHLNQWKRHFQRDEGENDEEFNKRFSKWAMKEIEKMHKHGVLGHFHISDNFGYDDAHLTAGEGNAPITEFVEMLKEKGYKDFIIETGSFNPVTAIHDTWAYFGAHTSSGYPRRSFSDIHERHFQYKSSPLYIAGAYAPSNQFKMFSEVPLH